MEKGRSPSLMFLDVGHGCRLTPRRYDGGLFCTFIFWHQIKRLAIFHFYLTPRTEVDPHSLSIEAYQQRRGKQDALRFSTVDFSGVLAVLAPDTFANALFDGIGHTKAFGCGLLLLRRPDNR